MSLLCVEGLVANLAGRVSPACHRAHGGISDDARGRQLLPFVHNSGTSCCMHVTHTTTTRTSRHAKTIERYTRSVRARIDGFNANKGTMSALRYQNTAYMHNMAVILGRFLRVQTSTQYQTEYPNLLLTYGARGRTKTRGRGSGRAALSPPHLAIRAIVKTRRAS